MGRVTFHGPMGECVKQPSELYMREIIISPSDDFWLRGSGDADIEFSSDTLTSSLLILPNRDYGFYLKYLKREGPRIVETRLSISDRERLKEVAPCSDEWMASIGLFLAPESAAEAVCEFARSGLCAKTIQWIDPEQIPEDGNW